MTPTPAQLAALSRLLATPDEELRAQAKARGVDVQELARRQRERIRKKLEERERRYEHGE